MTRPLEATDVASIASIAGVPVDAENAARIARSIAPALAGFQPIAGTLPFDLEPAGFVGAQLRTQRP